LSEELGIEREKIIAEEKKELKAIEKRRSAAVKNALENKE